MTYWQSVRWSAARLFLPLIITAAYAGAASERDFFGDYRLVAISQAWVLLVVVGPLFAGWAAWDSARLRPWLTDTFGGAHRTKALMRVLGPALVSGMAAVVAVVTVIAGRPLDLSGWAVTAAAVATMIAVSVFGAALGAVASRLVAVPLAVAITYGALGHAVANPSQWPARALITGVVAPCCAPTAGIGLQSLTIVTGTCLLVVAGGCLALASTADLAARAAMLAGSLALALLVAWSSAQPLGPDGQLVARSTPVVCQQEAQRRVCVWPEHARELAEVAETIDDVSRRAVDPLGLGLPARWSEAPTKRSVRFMWATGVSSSEHRYALGLDIAHWAGCTAPADEAEVAVYIALRSQVSQAELQQRDPALAEVAADFARLDESAQRQRVHSRLRQCRQ